MENLIEYLDESLVPLEKKVKEYLELEREITRIDVALLTKQRVHPAPTTTAPGAQAVNQSEIGEMQNLLHELLQRLDRLREEVVQLLPEKNKFIEVDLGYGPSMVGYFTVDHETHQPLPEPLLRVVH